MRSRLRAPDALPSILRFNPEAFFFSSGPVL
ncbi:hypothetical protein SAMN04490183_2143 [Pseudomonas corrugata]|nr:hypothetical protein SAMN04490183_2143 [Pseudomonas corrugata]